MEFTIPHMWAAMGAIAKTVVIILGIQSLMVVGVSFERLLVFMRAKKQSREFALRALKLLEERKHKEAADIAAEFKGSHVAKVVSSGLKEYVKGTEDGTAAYDVLNAVKRAVEKTIERQSSLLRRGLGVLASVGSTAPFIGLFGTVFGIINSFQGMAKDGGGGLGAVSAGIAEALFTTAVGIGVAVVGVLLYNFFTAKAEALQADASESANEIVDLLIKHHAGKDPKASAEA